MNNYKVYNKMLDLLNTHEYEVLKAYIETQKNKFYLENARKSLKSYLISGKIFETTPKSFFAYLDDQRIVLTNGISIYILNTDELLTETRKKQLEGMDYLREQIAFINSVFQKYEAMETSPVEDIQADELHPYLKRYIIKGEHLESPQFYQLKNFDFAEDFLGEHIQYSLCRQTPACIAESDKGKGLILGLRDRA